MPSGLVALLDDIVGLTKLAAASLDDVGAAAAKAGTKAAGVVIDDTAVTPNYVMGLSPQRELPIIWKIAVGSLRNKLLILLPAGMLLSAVAPGAITPILMAGGAFLCFEGAEKVIEALSGDTHDEAEDEADTPEELEALKVKGAIRTDLILSAEIMAIALGQVAADPLWQQAVVLVLVAIAITAGVYGVVGLIVKMDDIGLHLAGQRPAAVRAIGRGLVKAMPRLMAFLSTVGTAAMIWVGGGILVHGLAQLGVEAPEHVIHAAATTAAHASPMAHGAIEWVVGAIGAGILGGVVGGAIAAAVHLVQRMRGMPAH